VFLSSSTGRASGCRRLHELAMAEWRTYEQRREYLIKAVKRRREKIRLMSIKHKGNRCQMCGYSRCMDALEFHHLDPTKKDFGISSKGYTRSWEKVKEEIEKCFLLCANCHREVHADILQLPRATVVEKSGEFREAFADDGHGNPERSLLKGLCNETHSVGRNVQRLGTAEPNQ